MGKGAKNNHKLEGKVKGTVHHVTNPSFIVREKYGKPKRKHCEREIWKT